MQTEAACSGQASENEVPNDKRCLLDLVTVIRLSQVSVRCWRVSGALPALGLIVVGYPCIAGRRTFSTFRCQSFEDRTFTVDERLPLP